jgi:hypothetical protein
VFVDAGSATFSSCSFTGNEAWDHWDHQPQLQCRGGAVFAVSGGVATFLATNSFSGNTAKSGAGPNCAVGDPGNLGIITGTCG